MQRKNVDQLLRELGAKLGRNPRLKEWSNDLLSRLNQHYTELCSAAEWRFLQTTTTLYLYPDVTGGTGKTIEIAAANTRKVLGTGTAFTLAMAGQSLVLGSREYIIQRVDEASQVLYLSSQAPTTAAGTTAWSVRFWRVALPEDCVDAFSLLDRTRGSAPIQFISRDREADTPIRSTTTTSGTSVLTFDVDEVQDPAPLSAPVLALTTATPPAPGLTPSTIYEYAYCLEIEGREGPLSPTAQITPTVGNPAVSLTGLLDTRWRINHTTSPSLETGIRKKVYRRDVTNLGPWIVVKKLEDSATSWTDEYLRPETVSSDVDALGVDRRLVASTAATGLFPIDAAPRFFGPTRYLRFYPSPSANRALELQYQRRARHLVANAQVPEIPSPYEEILIAKVLQEACQEKNDTLGLQFWRARAEELYAALARGHLLREKETETTRRGWKAGGFRSEPRYGPITYTP